MRQNPPSNIEIRDRRLSGQALKKGEVDALAFASRNHGKLRVTGSIRNEFLKGHTLAEWQSLRAQFGIKVIRGAEKSQALHLMSKLGITSSKHVNDFKLVATSRMYGMRLMSGDFKVIRNARNLGVDAKGALFNYAFERRRDFRLKLARNLGRDSSYTYAPW